MYVYKLRENKSLWFTCNWQEMLFANIEPNTLTV